MDESVNKEFDSWLRRRLADNVRRLRQEREISQEGLSANCGFHRTYISQIERVRANLTLDNLQRIAEALQVEPSTLLAP
ncbi:helix-turn-helix transcriptional regulator [Paraburkholderia sediminicola]|uniref:helix-turn-helix domain-containing protein n=1 Tax=Paraburkholderia sediminicola TaxID=458836 RepID=UPI0038B8A759